MAKVKTEETPAVETPKVSKYNYVGGVSSTIEVEGKEIRLYNGAEIELPDNHTKTAELLHLQLIVPVEQPETENKEK